jgi:hypothetical protein
MDREPRESHVIPEFIYTPLYDDKHRFHVLSSGSRPHRYGQKGMRERLLCDHCEGQLSKHEKYVSEVLTGKVRVKSNRDGKLVRITGLDYRHFKIFALSVLWRAGISSLPMFSHVKLGPHSEPLRAQLHRDDPGPSERYGVFLAPLVRENRNNQKDLIVQPTRSRLEGHLCYRFVFGGLIWVFVVSNHAPSKLFRNAFVNEKGEMIMLVTEVSEVRFLMNAFRDIGGAQVKDRSNNGVQATCENARA